MSTTDTQSLNSIDLEQGKDTISCKLKRVKPTNS